MLHCDDPVELSVVLNEAVLLRPVGGPAVMAEQLVHMSRIAQLPNVTIQVLPFAAGEHPAMTTPYVILNFAEAADASVVYLDNLTMGLALEDADHVLGYSLLHEELCRMALDPEASLTHLKEASRNFA